MATPSRNNESPQKLSKASMVLVDSMANEAKTESNVTKSRIKERTTSKGRVSSLQQLKFRVTELLLLYERYGLFIPPSEFAKGKVWSSRNYAKDKKRQKKIAERDFVVRRIAQLTADLVEKKILPGGESLTSSAFPHNKNYK